ncbi:MAG: type II toxin-antitoxin system RelE/ParE family toxin [Solirubrobacteraceae bacterium]
MTGHLSKIKLAPRAIRDLKGLDRQTRKRVQNAFQALETDAPNLDIKPVAGHVPWRRLRVGEHRVLYHELTDEPDARYLVARVIDRRDLHRAIDKL